MEKHRSQGEKMHITYLHLPDGERKRHKSRCVYYKPNNYCIIRGMNCCGSHLCEDCYKEKEIDNNFKFNNQPNTIIKKYNSVDFNKQIKEVLNNPKKF